MALHTGPWWKPSRRCGLTLVFCRSGVGFVNASLKAALSTIFMYQCTAVQCPTKLLLSLHSSLKVREIRTSPASVAVSAHTEPSRALQITCRECLVLVIVFIALQNASHFKSLPGPAALFQHKLSYNELCRLKACGCLSCGQTRCMPGVELGITPPPLEMRKEREARGRCFPHSALDSVTICFFRSAA